MTSAGIAVAAARLWLVVTPMISDAAQDDPCDAFSWNVSHERALFAGPASALSAADTPATAPGAVADRLYQVQLLTQLPIRFAAPPGKTKPTDGPYAGLLRLRVAQAGVYRLSLDQPAWIDVLQDGQAIQAGDFQGRPGCTAPHKIVQFQLPAQTDLLIQLSGASAAQARLTVTLAD